MSPHLGAVPRLASAPIHQRPIVTVVEIPRKSHERKTRATRTQKADQGGTRARRQKRPQQKLVSASNGLLRTRTATRPAPRTQVPTNGRSKYGDSYRGEQRRLTSTSRALDGVIDEVAYPLFAERNVPRNPETRQMATERTQTYTTARWKPPASHDPRAGRCSVSPLAQRVGSRVRGWTLAGAADKNHHPGVENCWPELGKREGAARQRARR